MKRILILIAFILLAVPVMAQQQEEDPDAQYATELLQPGVTVPDFTLNDLRGNARTLSEFRGKQVVLVFWASWCPDCRAEVPELRAMMAEADPAKVAFVSVSYDRDFDTLCKFVEDNYIGGVQLFDPSGKKESKVGADFHIKWIPSLYLIDESGKVLVSTVVAGKIAAALKSSAAVPAIGKKGVCTEESCSL